MIISMSEQIKEKKFSGRTKVIVSRTFGDQNVLEFTPTMWRIR